MKRNILLKIKYDGGDFCGWQKQPEARTVQGEIEQVLSFLAGTKIDIAGTSRTDSGVHALGQCATFSWDNPMPTEKLADVLNKRFGAGGRGRCGTPGDIEILEATEVPEDFHARFSCRGKTYRYVIDRSADIFNRRYALLYDGDLDVEAMKAAAQHLVGTHDFKSFETSGGTPRETTVRTVSAIEISEEDRKIVIRVTGDGFLYNMVRIIVGTLLEIGRGERAPSDMQDIIDACDRQKAGATAPPQGLYLEKIYFDGDRLWE